MTRAEPLAWSPAHLQLPADLRLTPEQFEQVCAANPKAVLELSADGQLITITPTGSETGSRNSRLVMRLLLWADRVGGWKVFDSSTGFRLPDDSIVSPDAAVISQGRWLSLSAEQRRGFAPLCPDLVVELASPSDDGRGCLSRADSGSSRDLDRLKEGHATRSLVRLDADSCQSRRRQSRVSYLSTTSAIASGSRMLASHWQTYCPTCSRWPVGRYQSQKADRLPDQHCHARSKDQSAGPR